MNFEKVTELASDFVKFSNASPEQKRAVQDAWTDAFLTQYVTAHNAEIIESGGGANE